jgi:predicted metal-dependent phosphoesterase TrpH
MALDAKLRFRVDLHVHTRRYSPCAESLGPEHLAGAMHRSGLDGLVIAEHDHLWPPEEIARLNADLGDKRIYRGVEVSSRHGHFLVIGLDAMDGIKPGIGIMDLIPAIDAQQAAIIWAHPFLHYDSIASPLEGAGMPGGLHAVEVASGVTHGKESAATRTLAKRMGWASVGGSDAHTPAQVGCAYTLLASLPVDEKQLAAAIRNGLCTARRKPKRKQ